MTHRLMFTLTLFLAVANLLVWSLLGIQKAYAEKVYPGVQVEAQSLSGLTQDQVIARLNPLNDSLAKQKVTLAIKDKQYQPTLQELGYSVDVKAMAQAALSLGRGTTWQQLGQAILDYQHDRTIPMSYAINQSTFDSYLNNIGHDVAKDPVNMSLDYQNGSLVVIPAQTGVSLDQAKLKRAIQNQVVPGKTPPTITLDYNQTSPAISQTSQIDTAKQYVEKLTAKPLTVQVADVTDTWSPATLFSLVYFDSKDNQLVAGIDDNKLQAQVAKLAKKVDIAAVPKQVNSATGETIAEGQDGRQLNVPNAMKQIKDRLTAANLDTPLALNPDPINRQTQSVSPEYVLGRYPGKYIEVDLSAQRLFLLEGNNYVKTFIISTGKWDTPTPTGVLQVQNHIPTAWSASYHLYMDNWMAITLDGQYGIHQLPRWPDGRVEGVGHLGTPVSHGCIRLGPDDANFVYNWTPDGTPVVIHT